MTNRNKIIEEAYRLSELRLESQFSASLAADQRATNLSGLLIASAAILAGWAVGLQGMPKVAIGCAAAFLVLAAACAWWSARPRKSYAPGNSFANLKADIDGDVDFHVMLKEMGGHNDDSVKKNENKAHESWKWMAASGALALGGFAMAALSFVV